MRIVDCLCFQFFFAFFCKCLILAEIFRVSIGSIYNIIQKTCRHNRNKKGFVNVVAKFLEKKKKKIRIILADGSLLQIAGFCDI